ncbi:PQQ-dependent sugar dehydrogenase [Fulvimarina endophytica]|uniref:PQQ-dependent sugar dehydrogenase n=1 Tax=Fulvimarina endophytica TaxID=2293836 RepID=A0A371X4Z7_9HYPH|nr:PQQ-dependent sugar dehydrogenase [Fulvimarina endophytica]RFC64290.1 PQQ-dependent sugar dehydrogenase [Fulvimarina endophytica]
MRIPGHVIAPILSLLAAGTVLAGTTGRAAAEERFTIEGSEGTRLSATSHGAFDEPWAMAFLPDGAMLVTEKAGTLQLVAEDGGKTPVAGVPAVAYGGQGGLGDVVLDPDFAENGVVYLTFAEAGTSGNGAAIARGILERDGARPALTGVEVIWRQSPKVSGNGHYSHRIVFGPEGSDQEGFMFVTSGDRQKQDPAQDMTGNLGKILRLNPDGTVPADNPFQSEGPIAGQVWTLGNRNILGIDFDSRNRIWEVEMGPRGGDELNLVERGGNFGWPLASDGINYSGVSIPDHDPASDGFVAPKLSWTPVISPASLLIYGGDVFADWRDDALIAALSGEALVHVSIDDETASETERFSWDRRVREVDEAPDGAVFVLEDGPDGRLIELRPGEGG